MSIVKTICTKEMNRFASAAHRLQAISKHPILSTGKPLANVVQLIFLLFSVPCFKLSNLFFKVAYLTQQRELIRLGRECARLDGQDFSIKFDGLFPDGVGVVKTHKLLSNRPKRAAICGRRQYAPIADRSGSCAR